MPSSLQRPAPLTLLRDHSQTPIPQDGWALPRDNSTGRVTVDPAVFPSGIPAFSSYLHARNLSFGIYTDAGPLTCLGYQPTQPKRPGSCGFETIDAQTYAEWEVDQVKMDGCGSCAHNSYVAMRDALNATGRRFFFSTSPGSQDPAVSNDWRTGPDLYSSDYSMWTNRLDLATTPAQAALAGPGAFPNPDFLEVGYSPREPKGPNVMTALEQRSMFTFWAALPTNLILSADLRPGAASGGIDADALATLTNHEAIAINQDAAARPLVIVSNSSDGGVQAWARPLASGTVAVVLFFRGASTAGPMPDPPAVAEISVTAAQAGLPAQASFAVRDLWLHADLGVYSGSFSANVTQRDARLYTFTAQA